MSQKVVTFGEIMLRLKSPGYERFFQSPVLEATFGGGEANVSVSLANYGMDTAFVTVLPNNDIGDACIRELRGFGVDTTKIVRRDGRMGIYYLETGAVQRPSKVIYDRAGSAICNAKPGDIDWASVFVVPHHWHHPCHQRGGGGAVSGSGSGGEEAGPACELRPELSQKSLEVRQDRRPVDDSAGSLRGYRHCQ